MTPEGDPIIINIDASPPRPSLGGLVSIKKRITIDGGAVVYVLEHPLRQRGDSDRVRAAKQKATSAAQAMRNQILSLRQLELHEGLNAYANGAVAKAVHDIVGVQFRNMATVGGSLFGRFGFSDVLTVFLAMDAYVELYRGGIVPLETFANMEKDRDILVRLIVKKKPGCFAYQAMRNQRTDFPILTCAASKVDGEYRVVVGARPARARVLRDEKGLLSGGVNEESAKAFAAFAAETLPTGGNVRGTAEYRTHLIRVLTRRTLTELEG